MARSDERPRARELIAALFALAATLVACAEYDNQAPHSGGAGGASGASGVSGASGAGTATAGDSGDQAGSAGTGSAVAGSAGSGGSAGASGRGNGGSDDSYAGAGSGGTSGSALGGGGSGGSAGGGAGQAAGGTGGTPGVAEKLLSQGKPVTADSFEMGHEAPFGNDGVSTTRYCAVNSAVGHYWQVDLGKAYAITKLHIIWEKSALYQFKVEGSQDNSAWFSILDETKSTSTSANQTYLLTTTVGARWVRLTATTLPNTTTWLSFFEFEVSGH